MNVRMIKSVLKEYGLQWAVNRSFYSIKLKIFSSFPETEMIFEKRAGYPTRIDLFSPNILAIQVFLRELLKDKKMHLIKLADNACEGKIWGFNSIELDYGYPINWQLNPVTGKECDITKKWYQIPDFDPVRGDIKVIWEASRFSHFITLARAYMLTENEKYYKAFSNQLADWIKKNPYSYGANFKCGQECSLRMVNGLLAYIVFKDFGLATDADRENIEVLILRCYRKVCSNFFYAYKCSKNNHAISELVGMIVGAWCCGEKKQLAYAFQTLDKVVNEQFMDDGGYTQYSFNYERLALMDMEVIFSIEDKTGHKLSKASRKKLLAAAKLMYQCQDESGNMPNYGSNDGAWVFPVTCCEYRDFRSVINTITVLISGKRLYHAGDYDEELLWFGNSQDCPTNHVERVSKSFNNAGLFTIRKSDSWAMIVLNDYKSRPAHMDQLHFDLWANGRNILCDGGTYSYASKEGRELAKNESHNTVVYDNRQQMKLQGAFLVYDWTRREYIKHTKRMFCGEYKSQNGYKHKRTVEGTENGYKITDEIYGEDGKECKILFYTSCKAVGKNDRIELQGNGKTLCYLKSAHPYKIMDGYRSFYYLKKDKGCCIEYKGKINKGLFKITTDVITEAGEGIDG